MADTIWTNGAATRVVGTAGNWSNGAPAATGRAFFTSDYTSPNTSPNTTMAGLTAIDLALLDVSEFYNQTIGGVGSAMQISADKVIHRGGGILYYKDGDLTTDSIVVDIGRSNGVSSVTASLSLSGATTTLVSCRRGNLVVEASSTVAELVFGETGLVSEIYGTINTGCTIATAATIYGGMVTCSSNPTVLRAFGGTWTQDTATITTIHVYAGARVNLVYSGAAYANIYHHGGIIDGTKGGPKTITNYRQLFETVNEQNRVIGYGSQVIATNWI